MPGAKTTLLIEGSFEELTDEFAQYIDSLKKSQGDEGSNLQGESADLLKENKKDEVLKKLVVGSQALNQAPEKGTSGTLYGERAAGLTMSAQSSSRHTTC
jgi:translation initiation factor 3 subunit M